MEFLVFVVIGGVIGLIIRTAMNAGKNNAPKEYMYSCSQSALIDAIKKASQQLGYEVNRVDEVGGRVRLGVGSSMASFGEWIDIQLMEIAPNKTKAVLSCVAKKGRENMNKNRKNIEKLLDAVSQQFSK